MLKIGFMDYANVYPIFHYLLQDNNLEFIKGFPADLIILFCKALLMYLILL